MNDKELLHTAIMAAIDGGKEILDVYRDDFEVEFKEDKSPLTQADRRAHDAICKALKVTGLPILSEEGKDIPYEIRKKWNQFWLVDPLDGTKEFVKRNGEFTVNIALIDEGVPVIGVILAPVGSLIYFASRSAGAFKTTINLDKTTGQDKIIRNAKPLPLQKLPDVLTIVASRSHLSAETSDFISDYRAGNPDVSFISVGSSLKLCLLAEGKAHIYPRFGPTMEWDTAAGQAILEYSGGKMLAVKGEKPLLYNKPDLLNPWFLAKMIPA